MKKTIFILILFISYFGRCQNTPIKRKLTSEEIHEMKFEFAELIIKRDSLGRLNFLDRKYKYLNQNFKIIIPKDTFDLA